MRPTLQTRKPIHKLRLTDLKDFPIWEFATDEEGDEDQDETCVRPVDAVVVGVDLYSLSVAADFKTVSGKAMSGFVGVTTADTFEFGHGVILHERDYIFVPSSEYPYADNERKVAASMLNMDDALVFPLEFTLRVLIQGEKVARNGKFK
jgi:hypothetical protein